MANVCGESTQRNVYLYNLKEKYLKFLLTNEVYCDRLILVDCNRLAWAVGKRWFYNYLNKFKEGNLWRI